MRYRKVARRLVALLAADQEAYRAYAQQLYAAGQNVRVLDEMRKRLRTGSMERAAQMLALVTYLPALRVSAIGVEASEAIAILALHANYQTMKLILQRFRDQYTVDLEDVYRQVIPALIDRTRILESTTQQFGAQWLRGEDGEPFLYPVEDFQGMNERRAQYGLAALRRPRIIALEPSGTALPFATVDDMRQPTDNELHDFIDDYR